MEGLFIKVLDMSINASYLIAAVLLVRVLLPSIPKKIICILWGLAFIRLAMPFEIKSAASLVPTTMAFDSSILNQTRPVIGSGISSLDSSINQTLAENSAPALGGSVNPLQIFFTIASAVWFIGIIALILSACVSYGRLRKKVSEAVPLKKGIYYSDRIQSPFILGIVRPKIFLPSADPAAESSVIAHEKSHLKRLDHVTKPLAYVVLIVHWFNPLVWIAFGKLCKDIEGACDEKVVAGMSLPERKAYSNSLLSFAAGKKRTGFCPLAFGEVAVKERIDRVLQFKKPSKILLAAGFILILAACLFFMTAPVRYSQALDQAVSKALLSDMSDKFFTGEVRAEGHIIWKVEKDGGETRVYANTSVGEYGFRDDKFVKLSGTGAIPAVLHFTGGEEYVLSRIQYPADGINYGASIKEMFPASLERKALWAVNSYYRLKRQEKTYASAYLSSIGREASIGGYEDFNFPLWSEGFPQEIVEKLMESYSQYDIYEGTSEYMENGRRHVLEVKTDHKTTIVFSHYLYGEDVLFERITVTVSGDDYTEMIACGAGTEGL